MTLFCLRRAGSVAYGQIRCHSHFQQRMQMIEQNIIVYIFYRLFRRITTHETVNI